MNPQYRELKELQEQIENCEGWQIESKRRILSISYNVFMGNYLDLRNTLSDFRKPEIGIPLSDMRNRTELDKFHEHAIRFFHNYLAAAKSLVDHTRIFVNDIYKNTEFRKEYDIEVKKRFRDSPLGSFVQDLRNYFLHRRIPLTSATLKWEKGLEIENSIMLDVNELRTWDKWSQHAKSYLSSLDSEVDLSIVICEYSSLVNKFYEWLEERQFELHQREFTELQNLDSRRRILIDKLDRK